MFTCQYGLNSYVRFDWSVILLINESEKVIIFTAFWKYFTKFCEKLKIVSFYVQKNKQEVRKSPPFIFWLAIPVPDFKLFA
jgi:hypothetical protein